MRLAAVIPLLFLTLQNSAAVTIETIGARYEQGGTRYYFVITDWYKSGTKFCQSQSGGKCYLAIYGIHGPGNYMNMIGSNYKWSDLETNTSMLDLYYQMRSKGGFTIPFDGSLFVPSSVKVKDDFCIGFAQASTTPTTGGVVGPIGPCTQVQKPTLTCYATGSIIIDHGALSHKSIDGKSAGAQLSFRCKGAATSVFLKSSETDTDGVQLTTNGNLYSKLTVDNEDLARGVIIPIKNDVTERVYIKSTLKAKGPVMPGKFLGSSVITISLP